MGCSGMHISSSSFDKPRIVEKIVYRERKQPKLPNPDPNNYVIINSVKIGKCLILEINYPDCTNYEGNKILMFKDVAYGDLMLQKTIDPHFSDNSSKFSPIARFIPTNGGWVMARMLAGQLCNYPSLDLK